MILLDGSVSGLFAFVVVFAIGALFYVIWFRERVRWSDPFCIKCRYDLRGRGPESMPSCPECGADLTRPRAVGYMQRGRRPWLIWVSVVMMIGPTLPVVLAPLVQVVIEHVVAQPSSPGTRRAVVQQKHQADQNDWDELIERIDAGTLKADEAERVALSYIEQIQTNSKKEREFRFRPVTPSQQKPFFQRAYQAGLLSRAVQIDLAKAFYDQQAVLRQVSDTHIREKVFPLSFDVRADQRLEEVLGLPIERKWVVKQVSIDGQPATFTANQNNPAMYGAMVDLPELIEGEHVVTTELEGTFVYVDGATVKNGEADAAGDNQPPEVLHRWHTTAQTTLKLVGKNHGTVALSTDPALDPGEDGVAPVYVAVQQFGKMKQLSVKLTPMGIYQGALSYDVSVVIEGKPYSAGHYHYYQVGSKSSIGYGPLMVFLPALDESINSADIVLTPSPEHAARFMKVDAIWGKTSTFESVPIKRYDLLETANEQEPAVSAEQQISIGMFPNPAMFNGIVPEELSRAIEAQAAKAEAAVESEEAE